MPEQNGESISVDQPTVTTDASKGLIQNNENTSRESEIKLQGATRQGAISKLESKLTMDHPDWADDKVKSTAISMFEKAIAKPTGASSNEGNEDERGPENEMKPAAPKPEHFSDTGITGSKSTSTPNGLGDVL